MKVLITRRRSTFCSSTGCGTASTQTTLFSGQSPTLPTLSNDSGYTLFTGGKPFCGESEPDIDNTLEGTADLANTICSVLWKSREVSLHLYTKETYCTPSMCTLRACFVWSTHVTYTVTGRRKKNRVQSRKSAKREKEFSTYCKLYKFTYICIFDNGKVYKLMNIQHSCKYSLISIPICV